MVEGIVVLDIIVLFVELVVFIKFVIGVIVVVVFIVLVAFTVLVVFIDVVAPALIVVFTIIDTLEKFDWVSWKMVRSCVSVFICARIDEGL